MSSFLLWTELIEERVENWNVHPFDLPAVRSLATRLSFAEGTTIITGENGSGKSTLLEAFAVGSGLNAEGGSPNFGFSTTGERNALSRAIRIARGATRPRSSFFLRAESFFNVATEIKRLDEDPMGGPRIIDGYGGRALHEQSHGESFLSVFEHRLKRGGLYFLDEPEGALSVENQIATARAIHTDSSTSGGSQFVLATNSPFIAAIPDARVYWINDQGLTLVRYEELPFVVGSRRFLASPEEYFYRSTDDDCETPAGG